MLGWILFTIVWTLVVFVISFFIGAIWVMAFVFERDETLARKIVKLMEGSKEI